MIGILGIVGATAQTSLQQTNQRLEGDAGLCEHCLPSDKRSDSPFRIQDAANAQGIILNPSGERREVEKVSSYYLFDEGAGEKISNGVPFPATIVYGDNGDVYLRYSVTYGPTQSYVKGRMEGSRVKFDFPQVVYRDNDFTWYVSVMKPCADRDLYEIVDEADNHVEYVVDENNSMILDMGYKVDSREVDKLLSLIMVPAGNKIEDGYYWSGGGDFYQEFRTSTIPAHELPDGLTWERWIIHDIAAGNEWIEAAFHNDKFYVRGVFFYNRDAWIEGDIQGDKVIFRPQSLGIEESINQYVWLTMSKNSDNKYFDPYSEYVFNYDRSAKTITPSAEYVRIYFSYFENEAGRQWLNHPSFFFIDPVSANPKPLNPALRQYVAWREVSQYFGFGGYMWEAQPITVEGMPLLPENKFYLNLYLDGEKFYADPETYGCGKPMFDIPYGFVGNNADLSYDENFLILRLLDPFEPHKTVACQTWYVDKNGVKQCSDLVVATPDWGDSGIEAIETNGIEVKTIFYVNLQGQRIANPTEGVYMQVIEFMDGTRTVNKKIFP